MQSPNHYKDTRLMDLLIDRQVLFAEGNIMKYVFRWKEKDGLRDLYKARDYLNAVIAHEELQQTNKPRDVDLIPFPPIFNRRAEDGTKCNPMCSTQTQQILSESAGN